MVHDVDAAANWLRSHGSPDVAFIGAGLGANLALASAAVDSEITNLVLLSPGLNIHGLTVSAALADYGDRPLLLVADGADPTEVRTVEAIAGRAGTATQVEVVDAGDSGTRMLNRVGSLEPSIIAWLHGPAHFAPGASSRARLSTGELTDIETKGLGLTEKDASAP